MYCSRCGQDNESIAKYCENCGSSLGGKDMQINSRKKLKPLFFTLPMWIGIVIVVIGLILVNESYSDEDEVIAGLILFFGFSGLTWGGIYFLITLYRTWSVIKSSIARTTPGKAIGFLFIPLFNAYWQFVAVKGLADDISTTLSMDNLNVRKPSRKLALTYCILIVSSSFLSAIPGDDLDVIALIVTLTYPVIMSVLVHQFSRFHNTIE